MPFEDRRPFLTNKKTGQAFPNEPRVTLGSYLGNLTELENQARKDMLRKQAEKKKARRIARAGVDPSSLKGDTLNQYVEAARVTSLSEFTEAHAKSYVEATTLDLAGPDKHLNFNELMSMSPAKLADQVLKQKYVAENREGWSSAIYALEKKLREMPDKDLADLGTQRKDDYSESTDGMVLDYFVGREAARRRKVVRGSFDKPLRGYKREKKLSPVDLSLEGIATSLRSRVKNYVQGQDSHFLNDVRVPVRKREEGKAPVRKFKSIAVFTLADDPYLSGGPSPF